MCVGYRCVCGVVVMRSINISIKNSRREGSCGIKTGNITIWVHNLTHIQDENNSNDDNYRRFLCHFVAVEFHEVGHRYDGMGHCSQWYADMTDRLADYFYEHGFFA